MLACSDAKPTTPSPPTPSSPADARRVPFLSLPVSIDDESVGRHSFSRPIPSSLTVTVAYGGPRCGVPGVLSVLSVLSVPAGALAQLIGSSGV